MELAGELRDMAAGLAQNAPAMQTGVMEGLDLGGARAHHNQRIVSDLIDDMIADSRDLLHPAGHLPDPVPHPLHL